MNTTNQTVENETFWTDVSSNRAWKLAEAEGKTVPYAGYMLELKSGSLRCVRDEMGTRYQFKPVTGEGNAPRVGQTITVRGKQCEVVRVYDLGTVDACNLITGAYYRVTGLPFLKA